MSDFNSSQPVRTEQAGDVIIKVADATVPAQQMTVNPDGSINVIATATDLDIRDLSAAQDSVEVIQDTHDDLNANANLQVGNADVSAGNPVPISAASLPLPAGAATEAKQDDVITELQDIEADIEASNSLLTSIDGKLTHPIEVDATDLDIRDLSAAQDNVAISDGANTLAINSDGSINAVIQEDVGDEKIDFDLSSTIAGNASANHDTVVANGGKLYQVLASASGKCRVEVQVETAASSGTFNTIAVGFNSASNPNIDLTFAKYVSVPVGAIVRIVKTNKDLQAQDLYSSVIFIED